MLTEGVVTVAFDARLGAIDARPHLFDKHPITQSLGGADLRRAGGEPDMQLMQVFINRRVVEKLGELHGHGHFDPLLSRSGRTLKEFG
jgi:hypothetical protein